MDRDGSDAVSLGRVQKSNRVDIENFLRGGDVMVGPRIANSGPSSYLGLGRESIRVEILIRRAFELH